jgi:hypothetical protein
MKSNIAQWLAEAFGGGSPTEMGFLKWCLIFIPIMVIILAITDKGNKK